MRRRCLVGPELVGDVVDKIVTPAAPSPAPGLLGKCRSFSTGCPDLHSGRLVPRGHSPVKGPQQCGLAAAVRPMPMRSRAQQVVGKARHHGPVPEGLGHIGQFDDLFAQAAGGRRHLYGAVGLRGVPVQKVLVALDVLLGLGGPGPAAPHDPLPLHPEMAWRLRLTWPRHLQPAPPSAPGTWSSWPRSGIACPPSSSVMRFTTTRLEKIAVVGHQMSPPLKGGAGQSSSQATIYPTAVQMLVGSHPAPARPLGGSAPAARATPLCAWPAGEECTTPPRRLQSGMPSNGPAWPSSLIIRSAGGTPSAG
jgi:hypothetical protein